MKRSSALVLVAGALLLTATTLPATAHPAAGVKSSFISPIVMPGSEDGNEPYIAIDERGTRYVSWQGPGEFAKSVDGVNFTNIGMPDENAIGDVDNAVDAAGSIYNVQICGDPQNILHNCVYRSDDGGQTWSKTEVADMHPGAADRPWIEVFPKHVAGPWDPDNTTVYLEYHTFSPDDLVYVTVSNDGGQTFSTPNPITTNIDAAQSSACNTIPGGIDVDKKGNVYALWLSGNDFTSNVVTGCNYSQIGPFNKAWISRSLDGGTTWSAFKVWQGAFDPVTKVGDNADKLFPALAIDGIGQVQVVIPVRRNDDPVTFAATGDEPPQRTDLIYATSPDRGKHWATFTHTSDGSHFFPWIAAGSAGEIATVLYESRTLQPNDPGSVWYVAYYRLSGAKAFLDGNKARYFNKPQLSTQRLDHNPIHIGGICTFGIFCSALPDSNRNLADSISIWLDPAGGANAVWTVDAPRQLQQGEDSHIEYACQSGGPSLYRGFPDLAGGCAT